MTNEPLHRDVPGTSTIVIEASDLELSFGETPALQGASVEVRRGEILAVMGPSVSGNPNASPWRVASSLAPTCSSPTSRPAPSTP
jgi:ABC-type iron transport system FetAB ATPase subunit